VTLHAENGGLGYGEMLEGNDVDLTTTTQPASLRATARASFFDSVTSFEMMRGGRIDTVILAHEVDQHGNLPTGARRMPGAAASEVRWIWSPETRISSSSPEHCDSKTVLTETAM
jgi:acyl CoA:acetate/3-ketoacid CoA transferase beta subunit